MRQAERMQSQLLQHNQSLERKNVLLVKQNKKYMEILRLAPTGADLSENNGTATFKIQHTPVSNSATHNDATTPDGTNNVKRTPPLSSFKDAEMRNGEVSRDTFLDEYIDREHTEAAHSVLAMKPKLSVVDAAEHQSQLSEVMLMSTVSKA